MPFDPILLYAPKAGMTSVEGNMAACVDEARQADQQHTEVAQRIMGAGQ